MPRTIKIKITGSIITTGELTFFDDTHTNNGHTRARAGDLVMWHIKRGSGVAYITAIEMKLSRTSTNIFNAGDPHQSGASENWQGRINPDVAIGSEYHYSIKWSAADGTDHIFDPTIRVKP